MKTESIGRNKVVYYDGDITELPVTRFYAFQKYLLIDAGIGSTIEDIDRHMQRISVYNEKKMTDKVALEIANLRQSLVFATQAISPGSMAFMPLIYEINGRLHTDITDSGNSALFDRLNKQASFSQLKKLCEMVKKKWIKN
jgi:hypothetical protein